MTIEKIDALREKFTRPLEHRKIPKVDPVDFEIIKNRLNIIPKEMGVAIHNAAHSLVFAEIQDFSCALFDHESHMVGMGEFLPGHQGGMQHNLDCIIATEGWDVLGEGDVLVNNDAFYGGSHPPDLVLFHPIHWEHKLVGVAGCLVHHIDMGGAFPGSRYPLSTELYQEGIRFPPGTKLYERGKLRRDILNIFLTNVRVPDTQRADLMAQVSGLHLGASRVYEMAEKYGVRLLKRTYIAIQHYAAERIRRLIEEMPEGEYVSEDYIDDDGHEDRGFKVKCTMRVKAGRLVLDFTGTEKQAKGYINSHWGNTSANCYSPIMSFDPACPRCYGAMSPIEIIAERGSIVNALPTAPIGACTTESGQAVHNVVWHCLSQANPARGSGIWAASANGVTLHGVNPKSGKFGIFPLAPGPGGGGARQSLDGYPIASAKAPNITLPNVEVHEASWSVLYKYRQLASNKDVPGIGAGTHTGGPGLEVELSAVDGSLLNFTTHANHVYTTAPGVFGGLPGYPARMEVRDWETGEVKKKLRPKVAGQPLAPGDSLYIYTGGGGGYGPPEQRDPEKVKEDLIEGFVSAKTAQKIYHIALKPDKL